MKTLSAREYLGQLQELDTNINQDLERLDDMKTNACSTGAIDYSAERVQTSPSGDSLCKAVTNYVAFNDEINSEIDRFCDAKNLISSRSGDCITIILIKFCSKCMFNSKQ